MKYPRHVIVIKWLVWMLDHNETIHLKPKKRPGFNLGCFLLALQYIYIYV